MRRRQWLWIGLSMTAVLAALGAVLFARAWSERGAQEVDAADVVERYRREAGVDVDAGFLRPASGVYRYEADGTERLSVLDTTQQWGPTMPASVAYDDDCWTLRVEFSSNHWWEQRFCPVGETLRDDGGRSFQQFDFVAFQVSDTNEFTCDQPAERVRTMAEAGDSWTQRCTGRSVDMGTQVVSEGTNRFVGIEELEVGGEVVGALHYQLERTLSGDQTGTERAEHWYAVTDGMLLRAEIDTEVVSPSPLGDVTYTEQGEFHLLSLEPDR